MKIYIRALSILLIMLTALPSGLIFAEEREYSLLPANIVYELESGVISGETFELTDDSEASGGKAVRCNSGATESVVTLESFNLKRLGIYSIYVRVRSTHNAHDSFWFSFDDGAYTYCQITGNVEYRWYKVSEVTLGAGEHTMKFKSREMSVLIDKVILTQSSTFVPEGIGEIPYDIFDERYVPEYPETDYPFTASHPRVLLTANDVKTIKRNLASAENAAYNSRMNSIIAENYDCILPNTIASGKTDNGNAEYLNYISLCALYYCVSQNEAYGQKAISGIINYLDSLIYSGGTAGSKWSLAQCTATFYAAIVYDWCYPLLTDEQKEAIIRLCISHAANSEIGWPPSRQKAYAMGHSCEQSLMRDYLAFAIAVYDEYPEAYNYVSQRVFDEYIPTFNYIYDSGSGHPAGVYYGNFLRQSHELYLKALLKPIGYDSLLSKNQENQGFQTIYMRRPDGAFIEDGDDNSDKNVYYPSTLPAFLAANLYENSYFKQEMYRSNRYGKDFGMTNNVALFLALNNPSVGFETYEELPLSTWNGTVNGTMVARTGWEEGKGADTMVVSMKAPERFFGGHQHLDAGEFEIYYKGNLAIDSGVYGSYGNAHDYGYNKQTIAHNSMLIEGENERSVFGASYPSAGGQYVDFKASETFEDFTGEHTSYTKVLAHGFGNNMNKPEFTYLKGDLTSAYDGRAKEYTRTFMFNNLFDEVYPGVLIVLDKVVSDSASKKTWLIHSQEEPSVNGSRTTIARTENGYNGRLTVDTLLPEADNAEFTVVGGTGKEFLVGEKNYTATSKLEDGKWRVELSPKVSDGEDYFLNVMQVSDNSEEIKPVEVSKFETVTHIGVGIKDRIVFLSKSYERFSDSLTFEFGGEEESYLLQVDGLSAGTWRIEGGNGFAETVDVPESSGVAAVKVPEGKYTFTRVSDVCTERDYSVKANIVKSDVKYIPVNMDLLMTTAFRVYDYDGVAYVDLEEYADYMGAEVSYEGDTATLSQYGWYVKYTAGKHKVYRHSIYQKGEWYMPGPVRIIGGKYYVPILSTPKIVQKAIEHKSAMNMISVISYTPPNSNPADGMTATKYYSIGKSWSPGGKVTGATKVLADSSEVITITPNEGYYLKYYTLGGVKTIVNSSEAYSVTVGNLCKNVTIYANFAKIADFVPEITLDKRMYNNGKEIVAFAEIYNPLNFDILEYGIELSDSDGTVSERYRARKKFGSDNMFGIRIIDFPLKYPGEFNLKAYLDYVNGETATVQSSSVTVSGE